MTGLSNRVLRAFSLVVTDRRWAAPLSAMALGFGLFIGVAVGPDAAGSLAGSPLIVELPALRARTDRGRSGGGGEHPVLVRSRAARGRWRRWGGAIGALPAPPPPAPEEAPAPKKEPAPAPREDEAEEESEAEEALPLEGVVVHANQAAGSYAIAIKGGELISIHAKTLPAPGSKLKLSAVRLENGTFEEAEKPKTTGKAATASFRGIVTYVDPNPAAPAYTVSGRGSSILVRVRPEPSGAAPALPAIDSYATVEVSIAKATATSILAPLPPAATEPAAPTCAPEPGQAPLKSVEPAADLWQEKIETEADARDLPRPGRDGLGDLPGHRPGSAQRRRHPHQRRRPSADGRAQDRGLEIEGRRIAAGDGDGRSERLADPRRGRQRPAGQGRR